MLNKPKLMDWGNRFSPSNIAGLQAWYDSSYPGSALQDGAAHFTAASKQNLSIPTNANFEVNNVSFWFAGSFYRDSVASQYIFGKDNNGTSTEYALKLISSKLTWVLGDGTTNKTTLQTAGTYTTATFFNYVVWFDSSDQTMHIRVDNGTPVAAPVTYSPAAASNPFIIGADGPLSACFDGRQDSVAFGKPSGPIAAVIDDICSTFYNSGNGITSAGVTSAQKAAWGGISFWDMNEESGTRFDAWGTNNLTASTLAIISGATLNGNFETAGTNGGTITNVPTSTVARTANVATVVTSIAHGLSTGNVVGITGIVEAGFNSTGNVVTVINSTTFTYPNTGSDVVSVSDTTGRVATDVFANWSESVNGTSTIANETSVVHGGTHACRFDLDGTGSAANVSQSSLLKSGDKYSYSYSAKASSVATSPSVAIVISGVVAGGAVTTSYVNYVGVLTANGTSISFTNGSGSSCSIYLDDVIITDLGPVGIAGIAAGIAVDGNFCGNFVSSSSQSLTIADNASLDLNGRDFSFSSLAYFNSKNGTLAVLSKSDGTGTRALELYYSSIASGLILAATDTGGYKTVGGGDISISGWYHLVITFTQATKVLSLIVNNGTPNTVTLVSNINDTNSAFAIGSVLNTNFMGGRVDAVGFWGGHVLTAGEITALFNHGNGLKSGGLAAAGVTAPTSYWDMDKVLGITADSIGTNTLTNNNAVTFGQGVDYFGGAVSKWLDRSANANNALQATESKRPVWYSSVQNSKPSLFFDGVDDFLSHSVAMNGALTVFAVVNANSPAANVAIISKATDLVSQDFQMEAGRSSNKQALVWGNALIATGSANLGSVMNILTQQRGGTSGAWTYQLFKNATSDGSGSTATNPNGGASGAIGAYGTGALQFLNGNISEIIIYNTALSAAQIAQVQNYLNQKWAIY